MRRAFQGTRTGEALAARGDETVRGAQKRAHARDSSERDKRVAPPNVPSEMKDCVSAAKGVAIAHQNAHLTEQLILRKTKMGADPGNLEREEDESAGSEERLHAASPTAAEWAVAVEENPSEKGGCVGFSSFSTD
jgi:hypothetical protein